MPLVPSGSDFPACSSLFSGAGFALRIDKGDRSCYHSDIKYPYIVKHFKWDGQLFKEEGTGACFLEQR